MRCRACSVYEAKASTRYSGPMGGVAVEVSAWLPVGSVRALIVLIIGLNQIMVQRVETCLQEQLDINHQELKDLLGRHVHGSVGTPAVPII